MENKNKIVIPGEAIVESMEILPGHGTYRDGNTIYSKYIGIVRDGGRVISVIPLAGKYNPRAGDYVIGEVKDIGFAFWNIDINSPYSAVLGLTEATFDFVERGVDPAKYYNVGDLILVKVTSVTKNKQIGITMKDRKCRKLIGGVVKEITPTKVPRLIGKEGSMINIIKDYTQCYITVGQNGRVWIKGEKEDLAYEAVQMVDEMAHLNGLTKRITEFLEKKGGKNEKKK